MQPHIRSLKQKVVLDACVYISFLNRGTHAESIHHAIQNSFIYLHSIVLEELLAGCKNKKDLRQIQYLKNILEPTGRIVTPTHHDWEQTGLLLGKFYSKNTNAAKLTHDILIALSCRRNGVTLITENKKDFEFIKKHQPFKLIIWEQNQ